MTKEFEFLKAELDRMKENHTWQDIKQLESMQGPSVTVNHQKVIQLSSNNYLGFTSHPRLINAAQEAVQQYGAGTGSVRTIAGTFTMHQELEKKLAAFKKNGGGTCIPIRLHNKPRRTFKYSFKRGYCHLR